MYHDYQACHKMLHYHRLTHHSQCDWQKPHNTTHLLRLPRKMDMDICHGKNMEK
jgi:hypothetical protein